jgi:hypothetical protein
MILLENAEMSERNLAALGREPRRRLRAFRTEGFGTQWRQRPPAKEPATEVSNIKRC